jgi:hypothetical protein
MVVVVGAIALILGLAILASPQRLGHFAKDGKAPLLVGAAGKKGAKDFSALSARQSHMRRC